ncbi:unnamed protein product [Clonostachys rosea]|uniref:Fungal-type protein kinase domain-containing protein n=1 Tax=Bionectria ochroleuca TaxID=29856 RepID=A0ABY6UDH1_BIOOC|nr:unnamed protein product [Clonostachys rosea]
MSATQHCKFREMTCLLSVVLQNAKQDSTLNGILEQRVKRVHIEFFPIANQRKPHVVLRLILYECGNVLALQDDGRWETAGSCMFDSNNRKQTDGLDPGVIFRVHKVFRSQAWEMHKDSIISFIYDVEPVHTIREYICVILGTHKVLPEGHISILSLFELTIVAEKTLDGCRDIVSQWVIRLHRMGYMKWIADRAMLDDKVECEHFPREFHNFISMGFTNLRTGLNKFDAVPQVEMTGDNIAMRFGRFQDPAVERIIRYGDYTLPYVYPAKTTTCTRHDCLIVPSQSTTLDSSQKYSLNM